MAVKIVHAVHGHEVRFGDRAAAEEYAVQHGGRDAWQLRTIPRRTDERIVVEHDD